jgi:hypothetical protein
MPLDQLGLPPIPRIVGEHGLPPTLRRRLEVVGGGIEIERHDLGAAVCDELLAGRLRCSDTNRDACAGDADGEQHERNADRPPSQQP